MSTRHKDVEYHVDVHRRERQRPGSRTMSVAFNSALAIVLLTSCGPPAAGPCTPQSPNEIDAWYQAEVADKCGLRGYDTDNCPAMPEIEREYDRRYDDYARCGKP